MKQLCNWKTQSNPPGTIMFSLLFPSCCVTNHILHPGACWCRSADCSSHHSTSWPLQPGPGSSEPVAHQLPYWHTDCKPSRADAVYWRKSPHLKTTTKSFLLSNACWGFSRKKDRETLEDFRVTCITAQLRVLRLGVTLSRLRKHKHTQAPRLYLKRKTWELRSAAMLMPPSCG